MKAEVKGQKNQIKERSYPLSQKLTSHGNIAEIAMLYTLIKLLSHPLYFNIVRV